VSLMRVPHQKMMKLKKETSLSGFNFAFLMQGILDILMKQKNATHTRTNKQRRTCRKNNVLKFLVKLLLLPLNTNILSGEICTLFVKELVWINSYGLTAKVIFFKSSGISRIKIFCRGIIFFRSLVKILIVVL